MTAEAPLHTRILSDMRGRILSGQWRPGDQIPVEHELMKQYSCSRQTVQKVLTRLAHARMIERHRAIGTFVSVPHAQSAVIAIQDIAEEVAAAGGAYSFEIVHRRRRRSTRSQNQSLGVDQSLPILEVACRHHWGVEHFCYEERLISLRAVPAAAAENFAVEPPGTWLLHTVAWTRAEHRIRAAAADPVVAEALGIPEKRAVLIVERRTCSVGGEVITFVRLAYPADAHELVARFVPPGVETAQPPTVENRR